MTDPGVDSRAVEAVARLYHAWITGLVLSLVTRKNADTAAEFVFRLFRQQHLERFVPGLEKLGLAGEPHAVACARYHYLSNQLGGVKVEYLEEHARKAWVRYPPPRWIWLGTAICAVPSEVNRAMLRGWHAHNGVTLGNPRLGFVCTKMTTDGQPGLEGYYQEYDHDLAPGERLQFRPDEVCPPIDPARLPALDATAWPEERKAKAYRNYAMEYLRNALPVLAGLLDREEALAIGRVCGRQIGMHSHDDIAALIPTPGDDPSSFLRLLHTLLVASGDEVRNTGDGLQRSRWRLFTDLPPDSIVPALWLAPFEGLLAVHNRFLALRRADDDVFTVSAGRG